MTYDIRTLSNEEINDVSGGFVCGGLCVLGALGGAVALGAGSIAIGEAIGNATS